MAFIVQGNTPVVGANAYIDVATFKAYWADRGVIITFPYIDPDIEVAIVKASQYLDLRFEYVGRRLDRLQDLEWPRQFAYNDRGDFVTGLPTAVKHATSEYAYRALTTTLLADPTTSDTSLAIKSKEETVGPISEKYEFDTRAGTMLPEYPQADRILIARGLVSAGTSVGGTSGLMVGNLARGS